MKWVLRFLAAIAALVVVCVVVLLILGSRPDAGTLHTTTEIARKPADVWPYLTEAEKVKKWVSWLVEIREVSPTEVVWVMHDQNNRGAKMEINAKTMESTPPTHIKVSTLVPGVFSGEQSYDLVDLGNNRTRLETTGGYKFNMWFANLMQPLIMRDAGKKMARDLAQMKMLAEAAQ